jgi:dihydrofolate reductase
MCKFVSGMTISMEGIFNDSIGSVSRLYPDFEALRESEMLQEAIQGTGAVVMGRRAYDMANGDFTGYEFQAPIFVVTHHVPQQAAKGENDKLTFTFVSDGVVSAIEQAKAAAGDKDVTIVGGASTFQQGLKAGLVDELQIDLMPVLLGGGLRLFENLDRAEIGLESITVVPLPGGRTHMRYRVVK